MANLVEILPRSEWNAPEPFGDGGSIKMPTRDVYLHHTDGGQGVGAIKSIDDYHRKKRNYRAIAYSFIVDPLDMKVYEGRGAGKIGAHTLGRNTVSHGVAVLGDYENDHEVTPELIDLLARLLAHGVQQKWWHAKFTPHQKVVNTLCPGKELIGAIPSINKIAESYLNGTIIVVDQPTDKTTEFVKLVQRFLQASGLYNAIIDGDPGVLTTAGWDTLTQHYDRNGHSHSTLEEIGTVWTRYNESRLF